MKVVALVQARMGSIRLPGKVLKSIANKSMIEILLTRLSQSSELDEIVVATSIDVQNDMLKSTVESLGFQCTRGSEKDVLNRFYESAKFLDADVVVRITGDCPLVDSGLVNECVQGFRESKVDYFSNIDPATYPDGLDVEVMSFQSLQRANKEADSQYDREHVTSYIRNSGNFSKSSIQFTENLSNQRWTVDEPADLAVVTKVFEYFSPNIFFDWKQILELTKLEPELFSGNKAIINNEGSTIGTGQKLYKRAKRVIPGGNMLLSKRPEMFLPEQWPSYFEKASGCHVWDLDGNKYIDVSIMGIGTNILGYGNTEVDKAVAHTLAKGNMSSFNCPEEVDLAEKLVSMHPWSEMVKFARSGGEANAIAVRIGRAASGRDGVAICGYHGWHDWYLAANLADSSGLDGHLLPGLETAGVPQNLKGSVFPFSYNNYSELESLVQNEEIGTIKMEVSRSENPKDGFLEKVRALASKNNIVLIFDECTSGFRESFGGLHLKYGVKPDIAIFGKAIGNGYALTAVLGRREVMEYAQASFISSTFWTERIGPTAALKTLEIMEDMQSWEAITQTGTDIKKRWEAMFAAQNIKITTWGLSALPGFTVLGGRALAYKTFITQEMLKQGYLASNTVYVCTKHTKNVLEGYFNALAPIVQVIGDCENGRDIHDLLDGPICHSGFKRLN